ncbi:MAG TPA: hypothetical protein VGJ28_21060 [Micromonosporaceae bacterium]
MTNDERAARVLVNASSQVAAAATDGLAGAVWRITEEPRELDANVIRLPPGDRIDAPEGSNLDVLLHVIDGSGELETGGATQALTGGDLCWLAAGVGRSVVAGPSGLAYLSVHRRRPPIGIGRPS